MCVEHCAARATTLPTPREIDSDDDAGEIGRGDVQVAAAARPATLAGV